MGFRHGTVTYHELSFYAALCFIPPALKRKNKMEFQACKYHFINSLRAQTWLSKKNLQCYPACRWHCCKQASEG